MNKLQQLLKESVYNFTLSLNDDDVQDLYHEIDNINMIHYKGKSFKSEFPFLSNLKSKLVAHMEK